MANIYLHWGVIFVLGLYPSFEQKLWQFTDPNICSLILLNRAGQVWPIFKFLPLHWDQSMSKLTTFFSPTPSLNLKTGYCISRWSQFKLLLTMFAVFICFIIVFLLTEEKKEKIVGSSHNKWKILCVRVKAPHKLQEWLSLPHDGVPHTIITGLK